jgi:CRISPR-associated endonuclease Csy4
MDYYVDIIVQPDQEMRESVLMNMLYSKLHKGLVTIKSDFIGVSFPAAHLKPGNHLRLHGTSENLEQLAALNWLGALAGYCKLGELSPVPAKLLYRKVSRKQATKSKAKLRRLQKRSSLSDGNIVDYRAKMFANGLDYPYFDLISQSSGQVYRRFIKLGALLEQPQSGKFDSFGLSTEATVPWF